MLKQSQIIIDLLVSHANDVQYTSFDRSLGLQIANNGIFAVYFMDYGKQIKYWFSPVLMFATHPIPVDIIESLVEIYLNDEIDQNWQVFEVCEELDEELRAEAIFWMLSSYGPAVVTVEEFDHIATAFDSYAPFILWRQIRSSVEALLPLLVIPTRSSKDLMAFSEDIMQKSVTGKPFVTIRGEDETLIFQVEVNGMFSEYRFVVRDAWTE